MLRIIATWRLERAVLRLNDMPVYQVDGDGLNMAAVPGHRPTWYPGRGIRQSMGSVDNEG
jgi:hypothetical protein